MKNLFKTKKVLIIFTTLVFVSFFGKTVFAVWNNTFYNPGDTLDPECLPTDTDCDVLIPAGHDAVTLGTANGLSLSTQVLSLALASTSTTGALSSADWNTFNNKQPAGSYLTSLSGAVLLDQSSPQTVGTSSDRLARLWTTDLTVTNAITGSVTGNAGTVTGLTITPGASISNSNTGDNAVNSLYSGLAASKQDALSGTGFVKISGTTISYDNSAYITSATVASNYVPYTGAVSSLDLGSNSLTAGAGTFSGTLRAQGSVTESTLNIDRIDLGVQAGTPRMVFENSGFTTWEIDNESGKFRWFTPGIERLSLDSSGNLSLVTGALQINGTSVISSARALQNITGITTTGSLTMSGSSANIILGSNYLSGDGDDEGIYVDSTGNVGIGTNSPGAKLDITGASTEGLHISQTNDAPYSVMINNLTYGSTDTKGFGLYQGNTGIAFITNNNAVGVAIAPTGNVGIGVTSPTAYLHLKAGTATANTAPLKFTSGTLLGTTEAGTIEYDGTHLYFTAADAGTRYQLDQQTVGGAQTPWTSDINAAGFTLNGNSTASGNLTLDSTSHATKGNVLINPTGGNVGVGTGTPYSYAGTPVGLTVQGSGTYGVLALKAAQPLIKWVGTYNSGDGAELYQDASGNFVLNPNASTLGFKITPTGDAIFGITANSKVGIGTASPGAKFHVLGSGTLNTAEVVTTDVLVQGATNAIGAAGSPTNLSIQSNSTLATDAGGTLGLSGRYTGTSAATFAIVKGAKENATDGNYAGYLAFATRPNGSALAERMRISSTGNVGIGVTPNYKLEVNGAIVSDTGGIVALVSNDSAGMTVSNNTDSTLMISPVGSGQVRIKTDVANRWISLADGNGSVDVLSVRSGKVGIGNANPTNLTDGYGASSQISKMWISDTTATKYTSAVINGPTDGGSLLTLATGGSTRAAIGYNDAGNSFDILNYISGEPIVFYTNSGSGPAERMRILSSGNVGIKNSSPGYLLHVGSSSVTDGTILLRLEDSNSTCDFTANAGAPTCGSDETLKKNINDQKDNLVKVLSLRPVTYNWLTDQDGGEVKHGFIAQEVAKVMPELVTDGVWIDGSTKKFLQTAGMTPYIVGAIQELNANLESLTLPVTEDNKSQTFTERFFAKLTAWLGDATNGVAKIFTGEVDTKSLCVSDDTGAKTCITKAQLDALILQAGSSAPTSTSAPIPAPDSTPTPDPTPTPVFDPTSASEPISSSDPAPAPVSDPAPAPTL